MAKENGPDLSTVLMFIDEFIDLARGGGGYAVTWGPDMAGPRVTAIKPATPGGIPLLWLVIGGLVLLFFVLK